MPVVYRQPGKREERVKRLRKTPGRLRLQRWRSVSERWSRGTRCRWSLWLEEADESVQKVYADPIAAYQTWRPIASHSSGRRSSHRIAATTGVAMDGSWRHVQKLGFGGRQRVRAAHVMRTWRAQQNSLRWRAASLFSLHGTNPYHQ